MDLQINFDSQRAQQRMLAPGRVVVAETGNNQHQQLLLSGRHALLADRSKQNGGDDTGPDPKALMMMALGSYLSMAVRAIADRRGWALEQILVYFDDPCSDQCNEPRRNNRVNDRRITCAVELVGHLDDRQQAQLVEIANQHLIDWNSFFGCASSRGGELWRCVSQRRAPRRSDCFGQAPRPKILNRAMCSISRSSSALTPSTPCRPRRWTLFESMGNSARVSKKISRGPATFW